MNVSPPAELAVWSKVPRRGLQILKDFNLLKKSTWILVIHHLHVLGPVQLFIQLHCQVPVGNFQLNTFSGDWKRWSLLHLEMNHHHLGFGDVKLKVIDVEPVQKVYNHAPIHLLTSSADTTDYCWIIRKDEESMCLTWTGSLMCRWWREMGTGQFLEELLCK